MTKPTRVWQFWWVWEVQEPSVQEQLESRKDIDDALTVRTHLIKTVHIDNADTVLVFIQFPSDRAIGYWLWKRVK